MEYYIASETPEKGRKSFSSLIKMFNSRKATDKESSQNWPKPMKESRKTKNEVNADNSRGDETEPKDSIKQVQMENESSNQELKENKIQSNSGKNIHEESEQKETNFSLKKIKEDSKNGKSLGEETEPKDSIKQVKMGNESSNQESKKNKTQVSSGENTVEEPEHLLKKNKEEVNNGKILGEETKPKDTIQKAEIENDSFNQESKKNKIQINSGKNTVQEPEQKSNHPLKKIKEEDKNGKSFREETEPKDSIKQVKMENESSNQESKKNKTKASSGENIEDSSLKDTNHQLLSGSEVNETEKMSVKETTSFTQDPPGATTPEVLHTTNVDSSKTTKENVFSEEASNIESVQANDITEEAHPIRDRIQQESFSTIEKETFLSPNRTVPSKLSNTSGKVKTNISQKKSPNSSMSLRDKQQSSSQSSQSSLYSSGPSTSSLCHLTELSQPKPEALRATLKCLRQLHGKDAEQLVTIERHLRGLCCGPKAKVEGKPATHTATRKKASRPAGEPKKPTKTDDENALGIREAFDKFAGNLFAQLERKRALENYEVAKLQIPVELGYYRAAYDALVGAFGQPYHKCTLELYQQLAAEFGMEAEMFVMDKTPNIVSRDKFANDRSIKQK